MIKFNEVEPRVISAVKQQQTSLVNVRNACCLLLGTLFESACTKNKVTYGMPLTETMYAELNSCKECLTVNGAHLPFPSHQS